MLDNPCKNGGTCIRNQYHVDYTGTGTTDGGGFYHLDDTLNPNFFFSNNPGYYRVQDQPWACRCPKGFFGVDCTLTTDPAVVTCPSGQCLNGGTCFVSDLGFPNRVKYFQCACPCGYDGARCEIAAVKSNFNGFIGIGERMQFCASGASCLNGGTCRDTKEGTGFQCMCATSYYGQYCELKGKSAAASVVPSVLVVAVAAIVAALKF
jgi:hypothetical protein